MAASAGGIQALQKVLSGLPRDFPLPIATALTVKIAEDGESMSAGTVYLAPPRQHMVVRRDASLALINGRKIRHLRSSANPLFASAAEVYGDGVIAVVLTGGDRDATDGVQTVRQHGGIVIAQDEATSAIFGMPRSAIETAVHAILPLPQIARELLRLAS